jgi:sugar phosphate isomerase/epimerase
MRLASTTGDFGRFFECDKARVQAVTDAGFRYLDLSLYQGDQPNWKYMEPDWLDKILELKEYTEGLGATFMQAHAPGSFLDPMMHDEEDVQRFIDCTIRSIEICQLLGIKNTVSHNGCAEGISKEQWFEQNRAFCQRLFPVMERCGVNVLCENSTKANMGDRYWINSGKDMREFIKYVDHPLYHGCWDTGHANCEGSQYDDIMALGEDLYAIHYNDNRGKQDEHVAPFLGTLNHDEVMHALIDVGYNGYLTLECNSSLRPPRYWLGDSRAALPLKILAFSLPFIALSAALRGCFLALRRVVPNIRAQLAEQLVRIGLVFWLQVPLEVRMRRIAQREEHRFGKRVLPGGDMYERQQSFHQLVARRDPASVAESIARLTCPVFELDGTLPPEENLRIILAYLQQKTGRV